MTATSTAPAPQLRVRSTFRRDIEGLRAIAVGLVMLAHAQVPGMAGGFIGVDVFFVISGFLITGQLFREVDEHGRISLVRFWARRARRLLPASATVLLATAVLTVLLVPATRWPDIGGDLVAAALYVVNWRFAQQSVDYLGSDTEASPVQHFWSLAVEEQFYLLWPLLILASIWVGRRRAISRRVGRRAGLSRRTALIGGILVVIVPSLLWSIYGTANSPASAYFVTPTRLWELGIGALVALCAPFWERSARGPATMLAWGGLLVLLLSALTISKDTAWPGANALLPTLATAAVIAGGYRARDRGPARLLGRSSFQQVGTLSYSLYLWHWPLLAIVALRWGEPAWPVGLLIVLSSVLPAAATYVFVEDPVRRATGLSRVPSLALTMGAMCTALGVAAGVGMGALANAQIDRPAAGEARGAGAGAIPAAPATPSPTTGKPSASSAPSASSPSATPTVPPINRALLAKPPSNALDLSPRSITPDPINAKADQPKNTCLLSPESTTLKRCELGDRRASTTVAVVGDSKVDQWVDALNQIAKVQRWRLNVYTKAACSISTTTISRSGGAYQECRTWSSEVLKDLTGPRRPDVVLVSGYSTTAISTSGKPTERALVSGYVGAWNELKDKGVRMVALADVPAPRDNVQDCIERNRSRPNESCRAPRSNGRGTPALTSAAERTNTPMVTLNDWVCPEKSCPPVIGNVLVYRAGGHITATYAGTLTEVLRARLVNAIGDRPAAAG